MIAFLIHLRLHFQLILSGIFLWAYLLAGGVPDARGAVAFMVFHVLLYGGATAFNAYYDQDEGPITGLRKPPSAGRVCVVGGWVFMLSGAFLALLVSRTFAGIYAMMLFLGVGYSHPRVRFKDGPLSSLLVVALGQGALGFLGGAAAAVPRGLPAPTLELVPGGAAAVLLTTGLYPLTQVFQIDEDRRRGDRTFAVHFGPRIVFRTAIVCFALGTAAAFPAARSAFSALEAIVLVAGLGILVALLVLWSRRYDPADMLGNHDRVLVLGLLTSGSFVALIVWHLVQRLNGA
ncbi:MAG: UbiA family prenyltransferase [Candidatus Krumholzibacteriia bacterium]